MDAIITAINRLAEALVEVMQELLETIVEAVASFVRFARDIEMRREGVVNETPFARQWGYRRRGWFAWRMGIL